MKVKNVVASIEIWRQVSSDYDACKETNTKVFPPDTTVETIIQWEKNLGQRLGAGNLIITWEDE